MVKRAHRTRLPRTTGRQVPPEIADAIKGTTRRVRGLRTAAQWLEELSRLHVLSVEHGLGLHSDDPRIIVRDGELAQIGGPHAVFTVNLSAPDACVFEAFKRWFAEARKQIATPIRKRGPHSQNGKFTELEFNIWKDLKITEYCELLAWRTENTRATKADLGRWIGRQDANAVIATERALRNALKRLPALAGQVEHEMAQCPEGEQATSDRIARDISRAPRLSELG